MSNCKQDRLIFKLSRLGKIRGTLLNIQGRKILDIAGIQTPARLRHRADCHRVERRGPLYAKAGPHPHLRIYRIIQITRMEQAMRKQVQFRYL